MVSPNMGFCATGVFLETKLSQRFHRARVSFPLGLFPHLLLFFFGPQPPRVSPFVIDAPIFTNEDLLLRRGWVLRGGQKTSRRITLPLFLVSFRGIKEVSAHSFPERTVPPFIPGPVHDFFLRVEPRPQGGE